MKAFFFTSFTVIAALAADPKPSEAQALGKRLMSNFPSDLSIDRSHKENLEERIVPALRSNDWLITPHPISLTESFAEETDTIVTIFVKTENEFVRLSTTEKGEKPGSILPHNNPAYPKLVKETSYTGKMIFSDEAYMTYYDVIKDAKGQLIGAYFIGIPYKRH